MKDRKENASVCQQVKAAQSIQSEQHRVHRFESTQGLTIKRHSESPDIIPQDKGFGGRLVFIIKLVDQSDENSFWEIRTDTEGSIGRADHCSVTLHDDSVSRVHCKIMVQNGEPVIVDVNSSNHTLLNGESLKGISPIYLGDTIQIGRKALKVAAIEHIQVSEAEENRKEDYPTEFLTGPVTETLEEPKYRVVLRNQNNMIDRWEVETNSEVTIGRDENCSIVLHDGSVSRIHCKISITDIGAEIADKESVNHTFVNGKRLDNPAPLMVGDVIRVGRQTLVIAAMEKLQ